MDTPRLEFVAEVTEARRAMGRSSMLDGARTDDVECVESLILKDLI